MLVKVYHISSSAKLALVLQHLRLSLYLLRMWASCGFEFWAIHLQDEINTYFFLFVRFVTRLHLRHVQLNTHVHKHTYLGPFQAMQYFLIVIDRQTVGIECEKGGSQREDVCKRMKFPLLWLQPGRSEHINFIIAPTDSVFSVYALENLYTTSTCVLRFVSHVMWLGNMCSRRLINMLQIPSERTSQWWTHTHTIISFSSGFGLLILLTHLFCSPLDFPSQSLTVLAIPPSCVSTLVDVFSDDMHTLSSRFLCSRRIITHTSWN